MPASDGEEHRWQLLRWAPRHDSGVLYAAGHPGQVSVDTIADAIPFLVSTGDFAPADMQYRMHREHLWLPDSGLWGTTYDVDAGAWVHRTPTASGNAKVVQAMAEALRLGGDATPAEMRDRWQRETAALIGAMVALPLDREAVAVIAHATALGRADRWL